MPAESTPTPTTPPAPSLTAVSVADDREVEPLLRRATADISALTLRLGAATRRADEAERLAEAEGVPNDPMIDDEADDLRRHLDEERVEHQRLLDVELIEARAEAAEAIVTARAAAFDTVRAASDELDVAVATLGGSLTPSPTEGPVEVEPQVEVAPSIDDVEAADVLLVPVEVEPQVEVDPSIDDVEAPTEAEAPVDGLESTPVLPPVVAEAPGPSLIERLLHPEALMLVEIAFVVILLLWLR